MFDAVFKTDGTMERLKKIYNLDDKTVTYIQMMISKYILIQHLKKMVPLLE
jgi:hypothetical protein